MVGHKSPCVILRVRKRIMNIGLSTQNAGRTTIVLPGVLRLAPLGIALGLFLAIALHQLHLPGFYYDEALDLVPMLHVMRGEQPELMRNIGVGNLPVMLLDYMGSLGGYLTIPFMQVFGAGYVAARAQPIFFSCVTIVLAWLLARRWFGDGVAAITALLLAINPSFIWFSRQGISVTSVMTVFSLGSVLLLFCGRLEIRDWRLVWIDDKSISNLQLLVSGLLLGLGLWAKFLFFRWVVVLVVMGVIFLFARRSEATKNQSLVRTLVSLLPCFLVLLMGFVVGAAPLIYYNLIGLVRDGQPWTVALLLNALLHPTQQFGINNADFASNIQKSINDVRVLIDGSYFWYNGVTFSNVYAVPAFLISVAVGGVFAMSKMRSNSPHPSPLPSGEGVRFFALIVAIVTLVFLGAFTVTGLWTTHQFIMLPLPQMVVACAAVWTAKGVTWWLSSQVTNDRFRNLLFTLSPCLLVSLSLLLPFSRDLWVNEQHHNTLATTGGSGRFSDAVYKLTAWLDDNHINQPVALDWGIERQVRVLTADRVRPIEIFVYTPEADDAFRQRPGHHLRKDGDDVKPHDPPC